MSTGNDKNGRAHARLADVALRVGVSRSEVSRVLNGRVRAGKTVGVETRQRILDVAKELNYRPCRAAQNLVLGRTDTVALMIAINQPQQASPFLGEDYGLELSPHYREIIGAFAYTLHQHGMHLLLAQCGGVDTDPYEAMEQIARSRTCDGMIITDMRVDDGRPDILDRTGLPYVVRGSSPKPGVVAAGIDNYCVGYEAMRYLHSIGHRKILFYNIGRDLMSGQRRFEGFCQARDDFGLQDTCEYRDDAHFEHGMYEAVSDRLKSSNLPTAIFAEDEFAALGAQRAIKDAGLRIPEDISLMTCLNARFMRMVTPNLTVLNVHQREVAGEGARLLAQLIEGHAVERRQVLIPPTLEERGSTAPPRRPHTYLGVNYSRGTQSPKVGAENVLF